MILIFLRSFVVTDRRRPNDQQASRVSLFGERLGRSGSTERSTELAEVFATVLLNSDFCVLYSFG
jgi:hypothetical protein